MTQRFDVILKGGTVVNQDGEGVRDIGITNGRIAELGPLSQASAAEVIDCKGLHILPGVIDTQVHFREPGLEHKEDLETGSRSAVMGGVTAVFEMPNTSPADRDGGHLHRQGEACAIIACIAISPSSSAAPARTSQDLPVLERAARLRAASRCSSARRPARCWSRTTRACAASSR